ncbi:uncharacterized protein LOC131672102 [Phymastichus coffea]|uniref:uncharacterized protein LOC131672102 n=1 Tax=Phymastichus coffea TaxID=108790 RepID=UPI00273A9CF3|nr:uncharacterized protein LOC131672102 [Phymastichus coffea]
MKFDNDDLIKFYEIRHEIDLVIESIVSFFYNIVVTIKFINGISNEKKIKVIFEKIKKDWEETVDPIENQILTHYANLGKLLNILYLSAVLSTLVAFMCLPLTPVFLDIILPLNESRPRKPLIMAEFFIDEKKYFHSLVIHAFITAYYGIIPLIGTDTFYMNCIYHACGMLTILGRRIENCFEETYKKESKEKENYQRIRTCITQHQEIIE